MFFLNKLIKYIISFVERIKMGRKLGSKNKPKEITGDTVIDLPAEVIDKIFDEVINTPVGKLEEKMTELTQFVVTIVNNPNGTVSCVQIPCDLKSNTFGTPEVLETGDKHDAFHRLKITIAHLWG